MATSEVSTKQNIGKVTQVIGSTFDAEFSEVDDSAGSEGDSGDAGRA